MGLFSKDIKTMDDLLLHGLQDIYYAEQQITKALPKMIDKATNRDLAQGLKNHLEETNKQIERLDRSSRSSARQPQRHRMPGDRRHDQGSRRDRRRSRRQVGAGCRDRRQRAGGRALRDRAATAR